MNKSLLIFLLGLWADLDHNFLLDTTRPHTLKPVQIWKWSSQQVRRNRDNIHTHTHTHTDRHTDRQTETYGFPYYIRNPKRKLDSCIAPIQPNCSRRFTIRVMLSEINTTANVCRMVQGILNSLLGESYHRTLATTRSKMLSSVSMKGTPK